MNLDFNKNKDGLIPAIIQDSATKNILMLGYMNQEAVELTLSSKKVHFFSRSKNRIWMKGEESGNILMLKSFKVDCDNDSILIKANPKGPTCHKGNDTCWGENNEKFFLYLFKISIVFLISLLKVAPVDTIILLKDFFAISSISL